MKKISTLAIAAMMSLVANAQFVQGPVKQVPAKPMMAAPKTAVGLGDADLWGYYLGDAAGYSAIGFTNQPSGNFDVAIFVPGNSLLAGAQLCGVNMPGYADNVSGITAWASTTLGGEKIAVANYTGQYNAEGYNAIAFDEEVTIPESGLYVGYSFKLTIRTQYDSYPFGCVEGGAAGSFYLGQNYANFQDVASQGFTSAMQVFVKGMNLSENGVSVAGVHAEACAINGTGVATVSLASNCKNGVSSVGYTLTVNGVETTGSANLNIPGGLNKLGQFSFNFDAPAEIGSFPASVAINTVNGQPNEDSTEPVSFTVNTVTRVVPRMTVIEEYTGTACGYCPRGWVGMEAVKNNQSDKALVIAWHKYNSSDAMYQANYANLGFSGAPQCTVDRKVYPDPYYGEGEEGIMECVNNYNTSVPTVDITSLQANFVDEENKNVYVTANTEFLTNTQGYTIAFVLTADSLSGTTSAWKQSNYYYQYTQAQAGILPAMPELAAFCRGGALGTSTVALVFNDAMIGSSYASNGKTQVPAFTKGQAGEVETSEYTLSMPTKAALLGALDYEKVYVTALVIDNQGQIANAARVRVLSAGSNDPVGPVDPIEIEGAKISDMNDETQIMGEAMSPNAKYVVGANFAYYAPVIWNVETGAVTNFDAYEEGCIHAVNSNGLAVGDDGQGEGYAIKADAEGNVTQLYRFVGDEVQTEWGSYFTGDAGSSAYAVSEDGKIIAGFYFNSSYFTTPCIWNENNERIDLPLPTSEEAGFEVNGGQVRYMTPDGKVLVGYLVDNFGTWPACIWRQNEQGGYDIDIVCKDYWEEGYQQGKPYMVFNPSAISANGEWLALQIQGEYDDWDFLAPRPAMQAARLNLNTKAIEVLDDESGLAPTGIANDGTMLVYSGSMDMIGRAGYVWGAGKTTTTSIDNVLSAIPELNEMSSNTPCTISADGAYIQGFGLNGENIFSYVLNYSSLSGIENVTVDRVQQIATDRVFNLQGQQVRNMNGRGLYIQGGKKIMK